MSPQDAHFLTPRTHAHPLLCGVFTFITDKTVVIYNSVCDHLDPWSLGHRVAEPLSEEQNCLPLGSLPGDLAESISALASLIWVPAVFPLSWWPFPL